MTPTSPATSPMTRTPTFLRSGSCATGWTTIPTGADGTVCIGGRPNAFLCLDAREGTLRWEATIAGHAGRPTIAPDGTVFFKTGSAIYAVCGSSRGLADAPWPKDLHDERNTANSRAR